jgi:membrane protease YdiL (CAAX protease family)
MRPASAALIALCVLLTGVTSYFGFLPRYSGTMGFWALAGGPSVVLALVAALWARREELLREWVKPQAGDVTKGVAAAAALVLASWAFSRVVTPNRSPREIWLVTLYGQIGNPVTLQAHGAAVAAGIIVAAVSEELVWRGMVTQLLADAVGTRTAWIWAGVVYAVAYVPTLWSLGAGGGIDPALPMAALGCGLVWGLMAKTFGSLVPSMLAHAAFDWAIVMMFPLWGPK